VSVLLDRLAAELGAGGLLTGDEVTARAETWSSPHPCRALAIARPGSAAAVAAVLRLCHEAGQEVVPHGGGTGLVEGATAGSSQILLSLERLRTIEELDPLGRTATVQAGVTLQALQDAARSAGLNFPLDLGARGTATIGGTIATNAGGNRVLRYGMMRDHVLGIEVVLADGTILSSLNRLIKNNAGYDLKQLFIGSEGTLGVVTRAVLRLREDPVSQNVAFLGIGSFDRLPVLLKALDRRLGGTLSAFEVMWPEFYALVTTPPARNRPPLASQHAYYCLVESLGGDESGDHERFLAVLGQLVEEGIVADAAVAKSKAQVAGLWALRDDVEQVLRIGPVFMFDVALPIAAMENYVAGVRSALAARWQDAACVVWGHMGDCNLHLWISVQDESAAARAAVERIVYEPLAGIGGSVSAEHGIGTEKAAYLGLVRSPTEVELMRTLKRSLDPRGIMNPGRVIGC